MTSSDNPFGATAGAAAPAPAAAAEPDLINFDVFDDQPAVGAGAGAAQQGGGALGAGSGTEQRAQQEGNPFDEFDVLGGEGGAVGATHQTGNDAAFALSGLSVDDKKEEPSLL